MDLDGSTWRKTAVCRDWQLHLRSLTFLFSWISSKRTHGPEEFSSMFTLVSCSLIMQMTAGRDRSIAWRRRKKKKKKLRCTCCGGSEVLEGIQDGTVAIGPVGLYRWFYVILSYFFSPQKWAQYQYLGNHWRTMLQPPLCWFWTRLFLDSSWIIDGMCPSQTNIGDVPLI